MSGQSPKPRRDWSPEIAVAEFGGREILIQRIVLHTSAWEDKSQASVHFDVRL